MSTQKIVVQLDHRHFVDEPNIVVFQENGVVYALDTRSKALIAQGQDASTVIQKALDSLTSGRTWKETVALRGDFIIRKKLVVHSYTKLDLTNARLRLDAGVNDNLIETDYPGPSYDVEIEGGFLDGNKASNESGHLIYLNNVTRGAVRNVHGINAPLDSIRLYSCWQVCIEDNILEGCGRDHIALDTSSRNEIVGNILIGSARYGIDLWNDCDENIIKRNIVIEPGYDGIVILPQSGHHADFNVVEGNVCYGSGTVSGAGDGIVVGDVGITTYGNKVIGNVCRFNKGNGIWLCEAHVARVIANVCEKNGGCGIRCYHNYDVIIALNTCRNNNQVTTVTGTDGIGIEDSQNIILVANRCFDDQSTKTQEYGIRSTGTSDFLTLIANDCRFNKTGVISLVGANNVVKHNIGYDTEKSGVATITAGSTRVTVNHGLVSTPSKVLITPLGQPAGKLWVENITSSGFDIVTDTAPTSNLDIAWYAEV
jgi:parallel beta-helix repeat protein